MEQEEGAIAHAAVSHETVSNEAVGDGQSGDGAAAISKPNKWVAATLSFLVPALGLLNVAQPTWAAVYFFAGVMMSRRFEGDEHLPLAVALLMVLGIRVVAAVHAYRLAEQYPADKARPFYSRAPVVVGLYAGLLLLVFAVPALLALAARASCVGATCG